jgi:integrase
VATRTCYQARLDVRKQLAVGRRREPLKTKASHRSVPLTASLVTKLRAHKEEAFALGQARPEDFVFRNRTGGPMSDRGVTLRGLDVAIKKAGINDDPTKPKLTWHDLRRTCGSLLLSRGANLPYVARFLGHSNPGVTARVYAKVLDSSAQDEQATAIFDDILRGKSVESGGGERWRTEPAEEPTRVAFLRE